MMNRFGLLLVPGILCAQAPVAFGTHTYQPGIDVVDYSFSLTLPDSGPGLHASARISLRHVPAVSHLQLDLVDAMNVRGVSVNGRSVTPTRLHDKVDVPLVGTRDSVLVEVVYDGNVSDGLIVRKDERGRWTWFGDNWPNRARQWLPTVDHPSDKATVTWTVNAPTALTVVASGSLVSTTAAGSRSTTIWRESRPVTTYVMVIAAAPLARYDVPAACHVGDERQCVKQTVYVLPENTAWLPGVFTAVDSIVGFYESLVGPFPYEKLAHLQSSTRFGGMENSSAIFYDGRLFADQKVRDGLLAHETAHQWFGDAVTEREWGHLWLSEGFATYFAALYTRYAHGEAAFNAEIARIHREIMNDKTVATRPVIDSTQTNLMALLNANSYQKGGYFLYLLNRKIGDAAFFAGLRNYQNTYRHGTALTDDLRRELEKTSGTDLKDFFDLWLRHPGVPDSAVP
jgi:aminopeptidase N